MSQPQAKPKPFAAATYSAPRQVVAMRPATTPPPTSNRRPSVTFDAPAKPAGANQTAHYLKTKVLTATPEQLQLMLYDGALRFGEQARVALEEKRFDQSFELITRVQQIVNELQCNLKPDLAPDICKNLAALYSFAYMRLVDANINHSLESLEEAMKVLRYQRETWMMVMQEIGRERAAGVAGKIDFPEDDANVRQIERLSLQG